MVLLIKALNMRLYPNHQRKHKSRLRNLVIVSHCISWLSRSVIIRWKTRVMLEICIAVSNHSTWLPPLLSNSRQRSRKSRQRRSKRSQRRSSQSFQNLSTTSMRPHNIWIHYIWIMRLVRLITSSIMLTITNMISSQSISTSTPSSRQCHLDHTIWISKMKS